LHRDAIREVRIGQPANQALAGVEVLQTIENQKEAYQQVVQQKVVCQLAVYLLVVYRLAVCQEGAFQPEEHQLGASQ
jgi:hypothetical protein